MFGARYFDFVGSVVTERYAGSPGAGQDAYEMKAFTEITQDNHFLTLNGWVARGAIREDDYPDKSIPSDDLCQSNEAPCTRVINHFFDPYNNVSFTQSPFGGVIPERSPNWGIGTTNAFATTVTPNSSRSNHFSAFDAREAMYRALTLRRTPALGTTYVDIFSSGSGTDAEHASVQRGYWATTFRALGDLIHLVQDMAQPQHTRSDMHAGNSYDRGIFGHMSFYEKYVDARVRGDHAFSPSDNEPPVRVTPLIVEANAYPIPQFNTYADYWSTSPGSGSLSGKGLADYSNRGFYSANTNIGSGVNYPQPPQQVSADSLVPATGLTDIVNKPVTGGAVKFVMASVYDSVLNEPTAGVRISSFGAFDQFLKASGKPETFALNKYNLDDMAELLVPRAVAYSTGVLDYFFRGKLAVTLPSEKVYSVADYSSNVGFTKIRALIKNETANIVAPGGATYAQSSSIAAGTVVAVLRYRGGVSSSCLAFPSLQGAPQYDPLHPDTPIWTGEAQCRTPSIRDPNGEVLPKIIVSDQINLADVQNLPAAGIDEAPFPIVFNFQQPLPFSALDVELQVIYRGPLGAETDGIAVGFEQLSEPTFYDFHNTSDCGNPLPTCGVDCPKLSASVNLPFDIEYGPVDAEVVDLPPGRFARVAFLTRATITDRRGDNTLRYVVNNQDFAAEQYVTDEADPNLVLEIWPNGVKQTAPLMKIRTMTTGEDVLTWRATVKDGECVDPSCFASVYQSCPRLANDQPLPATVWFPDTKPPQ